MGNGSSAPGRDAEGSREIERSYMGRRDASVFVDWAPDAVDHMVLNFLRNEQRALKAAAASGGLAPDPAIVTHLVSMGFTVNAAKRAAFATMNVGGEEPATQWAFAHMEDEDLNAPLGPLYSTQSASLKVDLKATVRRGLHPRARRPRPPRLTFEHFCISPVRRRARDHLGDARGPPGNGGAVPAPAQPGRPGQLDQQPREHAALPIHIPAVEGYGLPRPGASVDEAIRWGGCMRQACNEISCSRHV